MAFTNGEIDYKMSWYFGPSDYKTLKAYDKNLEKIIKDRNYQITELERKAGLKKNNI